MIRGQYLVYRIRSVYFTVMGASVQLCFLPILAHKLLNVVFSIVKTSSYSSIYCMLLQGLIKSVFKFSFKIQLLLCFVGTACLSRIMLLKTYIYIYCLQF